MWVEVIQAVAPPGALAAALVAWLRSRVNRFRLEVETDRGARMVLDVRQVKELDSRAVEELIGRVSMTIAGHGEHSGGEVALGTKPDSGPPR